MSKPQKCSNCDGKGTMPGDPAHCDAPTCRVCNGAGELYDPNGPRPYTPEEQREMFLDHLKAMARYWAGANLPCNNTLLERLEGFAFSVCSMLDGCSELPAFDVTPCPHPTDKNFHIENGENWWVPVPLPGMLHEMFHAEERRAREAAAKKGA
jgi:hypothetical protein